MITLKKISALLAFQFCLFAAFAQNRYTDTSATCIAFWKNKEYKIYQIKKTKVKYETTIEKNRSEAMYEAHIRIIDSTATGYIIEWTYKNFKTSALNEHALNSLTNIMEGLTIRYKTDDVGSFAELINWEEVRNFAIKNYEIALKEHAQNKEFVAALDQVKSIFQSKENIEAVMIKEIQLYHTPYGVEYNKSELIQETALPNVTGGSPIPAKISYKILELDPKKDFCKVCQNQNIDKGIAGPIIADMIKKLSGGKTQNESDIQKEIEGMEISDINEFSFGISSGWLSRIFFKRTTNVSKYKQIESYEISALNNAADN